MAVGTGRRRYGKSLLGWTKQGQTNGGMKATTTGLRNDGVGCGISHQSEGMWAIVSARREL
jgi:hypothetical protein